MAHSEVRGQPELTFTFYHVGSRDRTQAVRLGGKGPWSAEPFLKFLKCPFKTHFLNHFRALRLDWEMFHRSTVLWWTELLYWTLKKRESQTRGMKSEDCTKKLVCNGRWTVCGELWDEDRKEGRNWLKALVPENTNTTEIFKQEQHEHTDSDCTQGLWAPGCRGRSVAPLQLTGTVHTGCCEASKVKPSWADVCRGLEKAAVSFRGIEHEMSLNIKEATSVRYFPIKKN